MKKMFYAALVFVCLCLMIGTGILVTLSRSASGEDDLQIEMRSNTEYWPNENGKIIVELRNRSFSPINASCTFSILYPDKTSFVNYTQSTGATVLGTRYYDFKVPAVEGVYEYGVNCTYAGKKYVVGKAFHVQNYLAQFEFEGPDKVMRGDVVQMGWRGQAGGKKIVDVDCNIPGGVVYTNDNRSFYWRFNVSSSFNAGSRYNLTCFVLYGDSTYYDGGLQGGPHTTSGVHYIVHGVPNQTLDYNVYGCTLNSATCTFPYLSFSEYDAISGNNPLNGLVRMAKPSDYFFQPLNGIYGAVNLAGSPVGNLFDGNISTVSPWIMYNSWDWYVNYSIPLGATKYANVLGVQGPGYVYGGLPYNRYVGHYAAGYNLDYGLYSTDPGWVSGWYNTNCYEKAKADGVLQLKFSTRLRAPAFTYANLSMWCINTSNQFTQIYSGLVRDDPGDERFFDTQIVWEVKDYDGYVTLVNNFVVEKSLRAWAQK